MPKPLAAAGAALVAWLALELLLRLFGVARPPDPATPKNGQFFIPSEIQGLGYAIRPHFEGRAFGCDVTIDSHGMRGPERSLAKPKGVRRLLILGDSVAFGPGVERSATFSALLEEMLGDGATTGSTDVEVLNAAVPGYNASQQWIFLRETGFAWQPDVVAAVVTAADAEPNCSLRDDGTLGWENAPGDRPATRRPCPWGPPAPRFFRRHSRLANGLAGVFGRPYPLKREYLDHLDRLHAHGSPGRRAMEEALLGMRVLCRLRGVGFVIVVFSPPAKSEPAVYGRIREELAAFARREAIHFLDLHDAFSRQPASKIRTSRQDLHPSAQGHRVIAESIAPALARELMNAHPFLPLHRSVQEKPPEPGAGKEGNSG